MLDLQKQFAETDEFLDPNWEIKVNARVRFINLPEQDIRNCLTFPTLDDVGKFVQIKGKVDRISIMNLKWKKIVYFRNCSTCNSTKVLTIQNGLYLRTLQRYSYLGRTICKALCGGSSK